MLVEVTHTVLIADKRTFVNRYGCICTKYVLRTLLRSICNCLKNSPVLSYLELEGLLISGEFLQLLLKGLNMNKTVKCLSLKSCPLGDDGCFTICESLHGLPNIEVINLSSCGLTPRSGEYLAKLIKYQQINRYCESWHSSLRYEEPEVNKMAGLKRFTINNNPNMGDAGLEFILNELIDDLWIRAMDMQRCNITEAISDKLIDTLEYNRSLEVADFRNNALDPETLTRIFEILKGKQSGGDSEYQWCQTTTTLGSTVQILGAINNKKSIIPQTAKSVQRSSVKRQLTMPFLPRKSETKDLKENINNSLNTSDKENLIKTKEQVVQLYENLREETIKRQKAEERCALLQKQVDELMSLKNNKVMIKEFNNIKSYIDKFVKYLQKGGGLEQHKEQLMELQQALGSMHILSATPNAKTRAVAQEGKQRRAEVASTKPFPAPAPKTHVHALFENLTGKPLEDEDEDEGEEDYGINLELPPDTSRSVDSDSIETMKRFLEELSQDGGGSYCDLSELSGSSAASD